MSAFDSIFSELSAGLSGISSDILVWIARMSVAERIIVMCAFIIALFLLTVRLSGGRKRNRSETIQFIFAMALVVAFGFGAGWLFSDNPDISLLTL